MSGIDAAPAPGFPTSLRARFARATLWGIAGAVISRSLNMAAWVVCARILGKSTFGALSMVQSTAGMFGVVAGLGLGLTATKHIAELRDSDPARAGRVLGVSFLVAIASSLLMAACLIAFAHSLATRLLTEPSLAMPLTIGAGLVLFGGLNGFQTGALAGLEAFRAIAQINLWAGLLSFPAIVIGARTGGLRGAVVGLVAGLAINWLLNQLALRRQCARAGIVLTLTGCLREAGVLMRFTLPAFLASALVSLAMWLCNAWLVQQRGYSELGLYGAADRWRLAILFVPASMAGPMLSLLSNLQGNSNSASFRKIFRANLGVTFALVCLPAILTAVLAPHFMSVFGAGYREGGPVLMVLALSALPEALNATLGQPLITASMWRRFAFDVLLVCVLVACGKMLIPRWGGMGLAAAYAISFSTVTMLLLAYQCKQLRAV